MILKKFENQRLRQVAIAGIWLLLNLLIWPSQAQGLTNGGQQHPTSINLLGDSEIQSNPSDFLPPLNDKPHKIMVIDNNHLDFIVATGQIPRKILAQTHYALGFRDQAIWGHPLKTSSGKLYVLIITRHRLPNSPTRAITSPQSTRGLTNRRDQRVELNRRLYLKLISGINDYPYPLGWNFYAPPIYSLQNKLIFGDSPVIYRATTAVSNGQMLTTERGRMSLTREFRIITKVDGVIVDIQAVASQLIIPAKTKIIAIGVKYDTGHTVPQWQRPILAQLAGISANDWDYVDHIISKESSWKPRAKNPSSGAYGLCQSLPAKKMASAGQDYRENAITQLKWCHGYAQERYGSWEEAYNFWIKNYWW